MDNCSGQSASRTQLIDQLLLRRREYGIQTISRRFHSLQMRVSHPIVVVERYGDKLIATLQQQLDRLLTFFRR